MGRPRGQYGALELVPTRWGAHWIGITGYPVNVRDWQRDVLKPAAKHASVQGLINFQVLRRTCATLAHQAGQPLRDVQSHLRHSSPRVSAEYYVVPSGSGVVGQTLYGMIGNGVGSEAHGKEKTQH